MLDFYVLKLFLLVGFKDEAQHGLRIDGTPYAFQSLSIDCPLEVEEAVIKDVKR